MCRLHSSKNFSLVCSPKIDRVKVFNRVINYDNKESLENPNQQKTLENFRDVIDMIDNKIYSCPNLNVKKYFSQRGKN